MTVSLKKIDKEIFLATKEVWSAELSGVKDLFSPSGYYNLLDSVELKLSSPTENFYHYAIVDDALGTSAQAILEISHVLPGLPQSYLKVLSIRMTPRLDTRNADTELVNRFTRHHEIAALAGSCIAKVLELTETEFLVNDFKVYTSSTQTDIEMLMGVADQLSETILKEAGIVPDSHGNWLTITKV